MRALRFTKMQGAGNDFVMINAVSQAFIPTPALIRQLADRHFGIGADQVLIVEKSNNPDIDFRYRIFNADGTEVEQCGNGARCFARFVIAEGLTTKTKIRVQTMKGVIEPELVGERVRVMMGAPCLRPETLPFVPQGLIAVQQQAATFWRSPIAEFVAISMGNPSAVVFVDDVNKTDVETMGAALCHASFFPNQTNVAFYEAISENEARIRVFERGAGETLACGSGTCAAVVAAILSGRAKDRVTVHARGGDLEIAWSGKLQDSVYLTGDAVCVFSGQISL